MFKRCVLRAVGERNGKVGCLHLKAPQMCCCFKNQF